MNALRILLLHVASIAALVCGLSLLWDAYQDFSWEHRTVAEFGQTDPVRRLTIADEAVRKTSEGRSTMNIGLLLVSAGLLMDGLSAVLGRLAKVPVPDAPPKRWHRFCLFSKPRLQHPMIATPVKTRQQVAG